MPLLFEVALTQTQFSCVPGDTYGYLTRILENGRWEIQSRCMENPSQLQNIPMLTFPITICINSYLINLYDNPEYFKEHKCNQSKRFIDMLEPAIRNVAQKWLNICSNHSGEPLFNIVITNEVCPDESILIGESSRESVWNDPSLLKDRKIEDVPAMGWPSMPLPDGNMSLPYILLNATKKWHNPNIATGFKGQVWSDGTDCSTLNSQSYCERNGMICRDLESILMHEFGHVLGLAHPNDPLTQCVGATDQDIMWSKLSNLPKRDLSPRDKCAFCKLYCPAECNSISEIHNSINNVIDVSFNLYPNPVHRNHKFIWLEYNLPRNTDFTLKILDASGKIVIEKKYIDKYEGHFIERINIYKFNSGLYYVLISSGSSIYSRSLVVIK